MLTVMKQKIYSKSLLKSPWALSLLSLMDCQQRNSRIPGFSSLFFLGIFRARSHTVCTACPKIIATYHFCRFLTVKCTKACEEKIAVRWRGGGPTLTRLSNRIIWENRCSVNKGPWTLHRRCLYEEIQYSTESVKALPVERHMLAEFISVSSDVEHSHQPAWTENPQKSSERRIHYYTNITMCCYGSAEWS